jgi:asparagine synthase (glutamine-hydrolysing)
MCGIAGSWGPSDAAMIRRMTDALAHRGPDDSAILADAEAGVTLGHRRLSIIDLSPLGRQPMSDPRERYWIVYNGEVYNYRELRRELEAHGHRFRSETDTEVVLAAYAQWGADALARLRGMFAFAIWDTGRVEGERVAPPHLFLARDRFGIKPLLYSFQDGTLLFASELKSLLASGRVPRVLDRQAVWDYLSLGSVPQPRTILAAVKSLPAGHWLRMEAGRAPELQAYWDIACGAAAHPRPPSREDAVRELRALLEDAARSHLIADVPVGAFLSGGIDSTAVVGLMSQLVSHPIRTYSIGFENRYQGLNELSWARRAAQRFGTEHTEVVITGDMLREEYPRLIASIDQPSLDGTNTYFVSQATRAGVTVALSGIGGDELFAGYPHFRRFERAGRLAPHGMPVRASFHRLERVVPRRITHALEFLRLGPLERHASIRRLMTEPEKIAATAQSFRRSQRLTELTGFYASRLRPGLADAVQEMSYVELTGYMSHTLLRDADAMSMAHSLEVRPVLLDHPLAEFVFSLPGEWKLGGSAKQLFCDAIPELIPTEIANRRKMGFEFPLSAWLAGAVRDRAVDALESAEARAIFSGAFLRQSRDQVESGQVSGNRLWAYVVLVDWIRRTGCHLADA